MARVLFFGLSMYLFMHGESIRDLMLSVSVGLKAIA